jgi:2-hydroxychromene-2-carboxylate isomerase
MPRIEFYFDCSSPWTYLAFSGVQDVATRLAAEIVWKPIIVGGVFNKVNQAVYYARDNLPAAKLAYTLKDMQDWARLRGVTLNFPPACGHPVNSIKCMRACLFLDERGALLPFAEAAFAALWVEGKDLALDDVLRDLCMVAGQDADAVIQATTSLEYKEKLRRQTDELIARGGFGSPTIFVDEDMYFGNDRLALVERALAAARAR